MATPGRNLPFLPSLGKGLLLGALQSNASCNFQRCKGQKAAKSGYITITLTDSHTV